MLEQPLDIINKLGLHARAATKFASTANKYTSDIKVSFHDKEIDGKSIMALMLLAAAKGSSIKVRIEGSDEEEAMQAIATLVADRFGEPE